MDKIISNELANKISALLISARTKVLHTVNNTMVVTYFEIGRMIVEVEQKGKIRADYGKQILKNVSLNLAKHFGKGFSVTNLKQMRQFFQIYSIGQTVSDQLNISEKLLKKLEAKSMNSKNAISQTLPTEFNLSWSHYLKLMRIDDEFERKFYEIESFKNNWSIRELNRQYDTALFTRLTLSKDKNQISQLAKKGQFLEKPQDAIKDPYILEFIGLPENINYSESELEQKLIDKLEHFLLELGNGYTFVARQDRISFDDKHFRIDLVFYNRILKCFVLIDLKIGELKHQDIEQMQMYVNYYDRKIKLDDEQKTIGIILCQNKSQAVVEFTLPENNKQIFASKYLTVLPSKESLIKLLGN